MKLIITIPKDKYCYIQELEQDNTDYATTRMLYHAVKHGKPYLEQEQKTGHWIEGKYKDTCDKCRCTYPKNIGFKNYCPNCGAKMESDDKG